MREPFAEGVIANETPNTSDDATNTEINTDASKNGETPSNDDQINVDDVVNSWRSSEERAMQLEEENFKLKQQLASRSAEDDDDDDLDEEEIIEKKVQARIAEQESQKEFAMKKAEREADFMTKTSPVFRANKEEILKIAVAAKVDLREATQIFIERKKAVEDAQNKTTDAKKKNASQGNGTNDAKGTGKGSDPTNDNLSIADIYRDNL